MRGKVEQTDIMIIHLTRSFLLICVLLVQGCVTPQDAIEQAERALRKTLDIQAQQNALEERIDLIEQNAKRLEQKIDTDSLNGLLRRCKKHLPSKTQRTRKIVIDSERS